MNNNEIYAEIFKEYARDKKSAEDKAEKFKQKIYGANPRLSQIDKELKALGVNLFSNVLSKRGNAVFKEYRESCSRLKSEKEAILGKINMTLKDFEPKYKCSICKDTGVTDKGRCICFNKRLTQKYYQLSNLGYMLKNENFDSFKYELFSKTVDREEGVSPYERVRQISTKAMVAVETFDTKPLNMFFYGDSGRGKSYMCNCIAKAIMDKGHTVAYMSAYNLFTTLTNARFNNASQEDKEADKFIKECDLLIIDDLGTEVVTARSQAEFFELLNIRLRNGKSTLISANLKLKDINILYTERIFSRIVGHFDIYHFIGDDLRSK